MSMRGKASQMNQVTKDEYGCRIFFSILGCFDAAKELAGSGFGFDTFIEAQIGIDRFK